MKTPGHALPDEHGRVCGGKQPPLFQAAPEPDLPPQTVHNLAAATRTLPPTITTDGYRLASTSEWPVHNASPLPLRQMGGPGDPFTGQGGNRKYAGQEWRAAWALVVRPPLGHIMMSA
jgi:hypothetical protein